MWVFVHAILKYRFVFKTDLFNSSKYSNFRPKYYSYTHFTSDKLVKLVFFETDFTLRMHYLKTARG